MLKKEKDWVITDTQEIVSLEDCQEISEQYYYDDNNYITNSMLSLLNKSPGHLNEYLMGKKQESDAFSLGEAVHRGILEPDKFKQIVVWSERDFPKPDKTLRTKENKDWFNRFKHANEGKLILSEGAYQTACEMVDSIHNRADAYSEFEDSHYELMALKKINGVPCKSKGDVVCNNSDYVKDLKTTKDAELGAFKESCENYGYYRQAAMYCHMFGKKKFKFIVVQKTRPYYVGVYEVSKEKLKQGWTEVQALLEVYKKHFTDDPFEDKIYNHVMTGVL